MYNLYERIIELCTRQKITPYRMCKDIGMQPSVITDLKKGRRKTVHAETAGKIADYFNVSTDYLLGKEKTPATKADDGRNSIPSKGEIAADIISRLPPEKQEAALNYLRYLAQQESEEK